MAPVWLAAGQRGDHPIVVLRTEGRPRKPRWVAPWLFDVVQAGVLSRDTFELGRHPRVTVHDIRTDVDAFAFGLSSKQIEDLVKAGKRTVADAREHETQQFFGPSESAERRAELAAGNLLGRQFDRLARERKPTVFISYSTKDETWVQRLRSRLEDLLADTSVDLWFDSYIRPGSVWRGAIEDAIERARVAVLLVSESFHESDFIRDTELELLRTRYRTGDLRLLWLSIDGEEPPEPEHEIQGLNDPRRPLSRLGEGEWMDVLTVMAEEIQKAFYDQAARVR